ncbi:MAG: EamA family transporter [Actinomycetales bacterium]|nr:EamA family transporter [Actinomycetales bacterium]
MRARDVLLILLVVVAWGANFTVIELGLPGIPPLVFLAMRFVLVAFPAVLLLPRPRMPWRHVLAIGALLSLGQFAFLYLAIDLGMPAGLASLVAQAQVVVTVVFSSVALRERPTARQLLGIGVGLAGLALVAVGRGLVAPVVPLLVTLLAATSWGVGNVVSRHASSVAAAQPAGRLRPARHPAIEALSLVVWSALVVPVPALGLSLAIDGPDRVLAAVTGLGPAAILSTLYTVVLASFVGYGVWNAMLARYPAPSVAPFTLLVPIAGIAVAWLALGEAPTPVELLGGAIMVAGLAIAVVRRARPVAVAGAGSAPPQEPVDLPDPEPDDIGPNADPGRLASGA